MKIKVLLKSDVKSSSSALLFLFGAAQAKIKRNIKKLFSLAARPSLALLRPPFMFMNAYVQHTFPHQSGSPLYIFLEVILADSSF